MYRFPFHISSGVNWLSFHAHSSTNTPGELYHLISPRLWSQQTSTILPVISSCLHHPLQQISHMNTFVHLLTNMPLISAHRPTRLLSFVCSCNSLLCVIRERWVYVGWVQPFVSHWSVSSFAPPCSLLALKSRCTAVNQPMGQVDICQLCGDPGRMS